MVKIEWAGDFRMVAISVRRREGRPPKSDPWNITYLELRGFSISKTFRLSGHGGRELASKRRNFGSNFSQQELNDGDRKHLVRGFSHPTIDWTNQPLQSLGQLSHGAYYRLAWEKPLCTAVRDHLTMHKWPILLWVWQSHLGRERTMWRFKLTFCFPWIKPLTLLNLWSILKEMYQLKFLFPAHLVAPQPEGGFGWITCIGNWSR